MPSGHVRRRGKQSWAIVVELDRDPATGQRTRKYWETFKSTRKADALARLDEILTDLRRQAIPDNPTRQTVGEYLTHWLEYSARQTTAPNTYASYRHIVRNHIIPALGAVPLSKLTPQHLQQLYSEKRAAGYTRTVKLCHAVLRRALTQAVRWGLVARNAAALLDAPRVPEKKMRPLTRDQARRFLRAAQENRLHALYVLAISRGAREGELLGLKWSSVDLQAGTIQVCRQLIEPRNGKPQITDILKTSSSYRMIDLTPTDIAALKEHRARQTEEKAELQGVWEDWGLVFCTTTGTPIRKSNLIRRSFKPLLEKAGLPDIRFHDLRHTCATLLLADGENPKVVSELLGHASVAFTLQRYAHVIPPMKQAAVDRMARILSDDD